ncbi:hypothetical protein ABW636_12425 [Aquimarina sp. 2201CG1-2-11]|uniref:phenylacetate--CoA ligase family protein n=1 Tax=Aquimarina discodermiae TaxID=3231043 RepID=UPI003462ECBE
MNKIQDLYLTLKGIFMFKYTFEKNPYIKKDKIDQYQFVKLKKLLKESYKNVPYYTELFNQINFDPTRDFNQLEDLAKVPVLDKKIVRQSPEQFYNKKLTKYLTLFTSGSTGNPLKVKVSFNAWVVEQAVVWRHWKWAGYNFRDKMAIVRSYVPKDGKLVKKDKLRNFIYFSPFHINDKNSADYLDLMKKEKVRFLRGYPSSIKALADFIRNNDYVPPKIKGILVASERLSAKDKQIIESAFNCRVYNHYGLADICVMMGSSEEDIGLHNYQDYGYLELLEYESEEKNIKRIIGTNLHNYAMPLIRYNTGDLAEVSEHSKNSVRNFPVIDNVLGRNDSAINTVEGYRIPTVNFYTMFEYYTEIEQWQIVQKSLTEIIINIRANGNLTELEKNILKDFQKRVPKSINLHVHFNSGFVTKNEGKIPTFISSNK